MNKGTFVFGRDHVSTMYFGHWEPRGVSESCRTRIPGWANPRVYWTDAVAFRCTSEHMGVPATSLGARTTSLGAHGSADQRPGSADDKPGSTLNHGRAAWEKHHLLWERRWCAWKS
jgi:hypothetical protein